MNSFQRSPMTPQQLAQARWQLDDMRMAPMTMPTNLGQGIASLGDAFAYRALNNRVNSQFPVAPPAFGASAGAFPAAPPPPAAPLQPMASFGAGAGISGQGTPQASPGLQRIASALSAVNAQPPPPQTPSTHSMSPSWAAPEPVAPQRPGAPFSLGGNLFGGGGFFGSKPASGGGLY